MAKVLGGRNAKRVIASPRYLSYGQLNRERPWMGKSVAKINFSCPADQAFGGRTFVAGRPETMPSLT